MTFLIMLLPSIHLSSVFFFDRIGNGIHLDIIRHHSLASSLSDESSLILSSCKLLAWICYFFLRAIQKIYPPFCHVFIHRHCLSLFCKILWSSWDCYIFYRFYLLLDTSSSHVVNHIYHNFSGCIFPSGFDFRVFYPVHLDFINIFCLPFLHLCPDLLCHFYSFVEFQIWSKR